MFSERADMIKEPIRIICFNTNGSNNLIKGSEYLASKLGLGFDKTVKFVFIKGLGSYKADSFILKDGTPLSNMNEFYVEYEDSVNPKIKDYTGEFVKCAYSSSKKVKEGEIYYVEKQLKKNKLKNFSLTYYDEYFFKLKNIKRYFSSDMFEEVPLKEQRKYKLNSINGDVIKTGDRDRKFLLYTEEEKLQILITLLSKALSSINSVQNKEDIRKNIVDLMIRKGSKYDIIEEDVVQFLNNKISDLLKIY